jgi:hypothetical protein
MTIKEKQAQELYEKGLTDPDFDFKQEIGRASCRERVS